MKKDKKPSVMTDPYRKLAEEIEYAHYCSQKREDRLSLRLEQALRTTHDKVFKEGWNKAVEECVKLTLGNIETIEKSNYQFDPKYIKFHCKYRNKTANEIADAIRKLRKPEDNLNKIAKQLGIEQ